MKKQERNRRSRLKNEKNAQRDTALPMDTHQETDPEEAASLLGGEPGGMAPPEAGGSDHPAPEEEEKRAYEDDFDEEDFFDEDEDAEEGDFSKEELIAAMEPSHLADETGAGLETMDSEADSMADAAAAEDGESGKKSRRERKRKAKAEKKAQKHAAKEMTTPDGKIVVKKKRHRFRNTVLIFGSLCVIALVGAFFYFDVPNWQQLDVSKITAAPKTGSMYDNQGGLITTIRGAENRVPISLDEIPKLVQNTFLAAEDLRFYSHHGVDVVRLFGAVAANLREGSFAQGGSTITMQLIRQSHLSTQKTVSRKLEEIYLAFMLERQASKDEILEMYLNYIYFGNGAYGIQAAAQTYFGVDAKDLTLTQAAALAASLKAPSYWSPHVSAENNRSRRQYILDTMLQEGMIDQAAHDTAVETPLVLAEAKPVNLPYGWFVDATLDEAEQLLGLSSEQVLNGGYHIETTLSREHQELLEKQFETDVFPGKASDGTLVQGAAACVDTKTGAVLAIVGGRKYEVRRGLNRATQLRRQPGSSLKPLVVYAPAIDQFGYMTASVLKDEPTNFNGYKPRNSGYAYYGNVSIRSALSSSLNVAAVSLLNKIGVQAGKNYLQKVGIPLDVKDDNLALALGAMTYGVSPVQMAAAYAPFGNGGTFNTSHFITKITDSNGRTLYQQRASGTQVLKPQSAYLMTSLLSSVTSSGTGAKLSGAGTPVAGKTGTVNMTGGGNRDIWMACYNSEISCAFWMGFDNTDNKHKLQSWVSGGDNTALMATNFFRQLYAGKAKPQFKKPSGIISLEIDKQAIKWRGEPMLATDLTPASSRYTEVFAENNYPTKKSDVWTPPRTPNSFTVSHNESGYPLLKIQPADTAVYRVQRDAVGESFILTELYGTAGETLYFTDTKAKQGVVYTYRIIPVHAELLNDGIVLEGMQAVQVAQAKASRSGGVLDDLVGFLFGGGGTAPAAETSVQGTEENTSSIFWGE